VVTVAPSPVAEETVVIVASSPVADIGLSEEAEAEQEQELKSPGRKTHLLDVPNSDNPSPENIPEVTSPSLSSGNVLDIATGYHLPFRHNRGKAPARYSPGGEGKKIQVPDLKSYDDKRIVRPSYRLCTQAVFLSHPLRSP